MSMDDITRQIAANAKRSAQAGSRATAVSMETVESNRRMQELLEAMGEIRDSSREIAMIAKTIEEIAFQTNILSLNASVEAARAGEAGRGVCRGGKRGPEPGGKERGGVWKHGCSD